ncbi:MAG TPA: hypothetical protein VKK81_01170 [Candidatus Binatia bacterium]|nr:hypothetical protein [Candidatus Binatia bacterium]
MRHYSLFGTIPQAFGSTGDRNPTLHPRCMLGRLSPDRQAQRKQWWLYLGVAVLFPLAVGGCYWLKYGKLMRTHIDLLVSMSKKMSDLLEDHRAITLNMMDEFSYPLERARDFVRIVSSRYAERRSLSAFSHFLDTYAELVKEIDRLRVQNGDATAFHERVAALREQGEQVKTILAEEGL